MHVKLIDVSEERVRITSDENTLSLGRLYNVEHGQPNREATPICDVMRSIICGQMTISSVYTGV